jgi:hypothetical protein
LLSECRRELKTAVRSPASSAWGHFSWREWANRLSFSTGRWSSQLALASFCAFLGFNVSHWVDRLPSAGRVGGGSTLMSVLGPESSRVRDIRPVGDNRVHIVVDRVQQQEIVGAIDDGNVRSLLLSAARDPLDPSLRVDSVELLIGQTGPDVRDVLLANATRDPNAAVRLKALEGLRQFSNEQMTRQALMSVLQHDDNPGVRSEAIEVLVPSGAVVRLSSDLQGTLEQIIQSNRDDEYLRARCLQILRATNAGKIY